MSDLITISSSVLPDSARVVGFRGTEAISRPYEIEIFVQMQQELGEDLDLADGIGAKAKLTMDRVSLTTPPFVFAGVFANMELLHAHEGHLLLRCTMVPRLWQLGLSMHSRIFTKMKVPDIIKAVLDENGVTDVEMRLGSYETEEHVSQYHESDLDFISRWMEREGIFYFFEHGDDGEKLVLCDQRLYDDDEMGLPVRFYAQVGQDVTAKQSLRTFKCRQAMLPASVRLKDYDYAKPGLNVSGSARVAENGAGEVSQYGKRFFTSAAGERLARTRAEEMLARQVVYQAAGTRHHLRSGYTFELEEHPLATFNTKYLTVMAHHVGNQATAHALFKELTGIEQKDVYQVEIEAIPAKTQFRAESKTAWPRIYGVENGVVDGPAESDYAQIDEQGRYNCKFKYDESKLKNGKATTWVRMMQPHGGDIEGFHFPLRKGTEVVFSFLGGDVDRPVIAGVVPNAINPSPVTVANYTKNVVQTGGRNRFELEDKAGAQWIKLSTPYADTYLRMGSPTSHELILNTDKNALHEFGNNWDVDVGKKGGGNWTTLVKDGNASLHIPDGNWRIGVEKGIGIAAQKGIDILIEGGNAVPGEGGKGGFNMEIKDHGMDVKAKEHIKMSSETDHIELHAAKKVRIHADEDHELHVLGKTFEIKTADSNEIMLANEMKFTKGDSLEATIGNKADFFFGNSFDMTVGNKAEIFIGNKAELDVSNSIGLTVGNSLEATIGNKAELALSNELNLTIGAKLDAFIGAQVEMTIAVKLALELSIALEIVASLKVEISPVKVKEDPVKLEQSEVYIGDHVLDIGTGALSLQTYGVMIFL